MATDKPESSVKDETLSIENLASSSPKDGKNLFTSSQIAGMALAVLGTLLGTLLSAALLPFLTPPLAVLLASEIAFIIIISWLCRRNASLEAQVQSSKLEISRKNNELRTLAVEKSKREELETSMVEAEKQLAEERSARAVAEEESKHLAETASKLKHDLEVEQIAHRSTLEELDKARVRVAALEGRIRENQERAKPSLQLSGSTQHEGHLIRKALEKDLYTLHIKNAGFAPAYNVHGTVAFVPKQGRSSRIDVDVPYLPAGSDAARLVGRSDQNGECSRLEVALEFDTLLGDRLKKTLNITF